jgi:uncharacterized protein YndB with AHSA1/START domain
VARNQISIAAPPDRVFAVLSDPDSYGHWVVGAGPPQGADDAFPAVGSRFRYHVGVGPLALRDHTEVVHVAPPHELTLRIQVRGLGAAMVQLRLTPELDGTRVVLIEDPAWPPARLLIGPLGHGLVKARNAESLRRLKRLAER